MRYATETSAIQFLFPFTFRWITFLNTFFRTTKKKTLDYSLWFLQNFDETMTAGYFQGKGGGGNLHPLDCCLPHLQIGNNNRVLHFPKHNTPPRQNISFVAASSEELWGCKDKQTSTHHSSISQCACHEVQQAVCDQTLFAGQLPGPPDLTQLGDGVLQLWSNG